MNSLEMRHLLNFCRKHGFDSHLIDRTLTYSENKDYLKSLVPDFDPESRMKEWEAAELWWMREHPLLSRMAENTPQEAACAVDDGRPLRFSLKTLTYVGFSLRQYRATAL